MRKNAKNSEKTLKNGKKQEKQIFAPDFAVKRSFDTGLTTFYRINH